MPVPQAVIAALAFIREARDIKRRGFASLASAGPPGRVVPGSATANDDGVLQSVTTAHRAPSTWSAAWSLAGLGASGAAGVALLPGAVARTTNDTERSFTDPRAHLPRWVKWILILLFVLYFPWTLAHYAPTLRVFPGAWLSPTWGQVFGAPGYLSPGDVWDRISPIGTEPPPGWTPTEAQIVRAIALDACPDPTSAAATVTVAADTTTGAASWFVDTFTTIGNAVRDELLDPENIAAYALWFWDGVKDAAQITALAFLEITDASQATYTAALATFESTNGCGCPTTPATTYGAGKAWGGHTNGQIPVAALTRLETAPGQHLRSDAAQAFDTMARAYQADTGWVLRVTDSYRPLASQVRLAATKGLYREGGLAAIPGTSDHGWGLAVDLDLDNHSRAWMRTNAHRFGYVEDTPREPWHWAYKGGTGQDYPATATLACSTPTVTGA